ncbi:MAG: MATE family efflux transporter [Spirochaetales bacterium]|nr:MATE family efflux transporter [Spirochaetales bacterium]
MSDYCENDEKSALGSKMISSLMLTLAVPSVIAYVINVLYNIVDRIYIGHIQDENGAVFALTGLGICLPIIQLVSAFSAFAGTGGAPLAAIELGKSEFNPEAKKEAQRILGNSSFMLIVFSVVLTAFFLIFKEPILLFFGASKNTLPYADSYISIYLLGTIFVQFSIGLNTFITCQGHARTAMVSILIGACLNIILDPVFIFMLNMGTKGAALATIISQGVSAVWVTGFLSSAKSAIRLKLSFIKPDFSIIKKISSLGMSPFIMQATESAIFVVFNSGLQRYGGDIYVGSMTIMQSVMQIIFVPTAGFSNGIQPIISYNYGAKKYGRVREVIRKMLFVNAVLTLTLVLCASVFPEIFSRLFTSDTEILAIEKRLLPVYIGGMWFMWIQNSAQTTFVGIGNAKVSIFIACLRKVVLLIPLALILPHIFGVEGIFFAEPIATTCSALTSAVLLALKYKDRTQEQE